MPRILAGVSINIFMSPKMSSLKIKSRTFDFQGWFILKKIIFKIPSQKIGAIKKINPSLHRKTNLKTETCYAYNYILIQQIGLAQKEAILFAGHVLLMNKFTKRIRWNTGPVRDCGVFLSPSPFMERAGVRLENLCK